LVIAFTVLMIDRNKIKSGSFRRPWEKALRRRRCVRGGIDRFARRALNLSVRGWFFCQFRCLLPSWLTGYA
jgi:hypothetical protein